MGWLAELETHTQAEVGQEKFWLSRFERELPRLAEW